MTLQRDKGVGERTWLVLAEWRGPEPRGSVVMVSREFDAGGDRDRAVGSSARKPVDVDGVFLARREAR
nr:type I-E CRISPR-associated endoribonuclease Cas2 [Caballeronia sp. LZ050]